MATSAVWTHDSSIAFHLFTANHEPSSTPRVVCDPRGCTEGKALYCPVVQVSGQFEKGRLTHPRSATANGRTGIQTLDTLSPKPTRVTIVLCCFPLFLNNRSGQRAIEREHRTHTNEIDLREHHSTAQREQLSIASSRQSSRRRGGLHSPGLCRNGVLFWPLLSKGCAMRPLVCFHTC